MGMFSKNMGRVRCHNCGDLGHKSTFCQEEQLSQEERIKILAQDPGYNTQNMAVLCFKCKHYGHYANVCPMRGQVTPGAPDAAMGGPMAALMMPPPMARQMPQQ